MISIRFVYNFFPILFLIVCLFIFMDQNGLILSRVSGVFEKILLLVNMVCGARNSVATISRHVNLH